MITDPYKINYLESKNNFSFRPKDKIKIENIKLKRYVTDKTRVEKYIKSHREEEERYKKNKKKILIDPDDINNNTNNNIHSQRCLSDKSKTMERYNYTPTSDINDERRYLQPIMKFKPRTDLERIFDSINLNYYGKINRKFINEQLKTLGLVTVHNKKHPIMQNEYSLLREKLKVNPEILKYLIKEKQRLEKEPKTKEVNELIANMENIIHINKGIISERSDKDYSYSVQRNKGKRNRNKRRNMNNFLAKNILSEYQRKTHFKALCMCSLDLNDLCKKTNEHLEINKNSKNNNKSEYKYNNNKLKVLYDKDSDKKIIEKINNWKSKTINLYKKQFHKKYNTKEELKYLKELISQNVEEPNTPIIAKDGYNYHHYKLSEDEKDINRIFKQTNKIVINGQSFNNNDLKGISNAVLKECNYIRNYFDAENAGEGKTMITRGMTVNEFTKKYKLPK